jgi:hypothetical protein
MTIQLRIYKDTVPKRVSNMKKHPREWKVKSGTRSCEMRARSGQEVKTRNQNKHWGVAGR